jgi:hypothetical protein
MKLSSLLPKTPGAVRYLTQKLEGRPLAEPDPLTRSHEQAARMPASGGVSWPRLPDNLGSQQRLNGEPSRRYWRPGVAEPVAGGEH